MSTVLVVFGPVIDPQVERFGERLRQTFPRRVFVGTGRVISAGVYDDTPVTIALLRHPDVAVEAKELAEELLRNGVASQIADQVRGATARFELEWDLLDDPDPVPETADHIVEWAQQLAALYGGVPVVNGGLLNSGDQLI